MTDSDCLHKEVLQYPMSEKDSVISAVGLQSWLMTMPLIINGLSFLLQWRCYQSGCPAHPNRIPWLLSKVCIGLREAKKGDSLPLSIH